MSKTLTTLRLIKRIIEIEDELKQLNDNSFINRYVEFMLRKIIRKDYLHLKEIFDESNYNETQYLKNKLKLTNNPNICNTKSINTKNKSYYEDKFNNFFIFFLELVRDTVIGTELESKIFKNSKITTNNKEEVNDCLSLINVEFIKKLSNKQIEQIIDIFKSEYNLIIKLLETLKRRFSLRNFSLFKDFNKIDELFINQFENPFEFICYSLEVYWFLKNYLKIKKFKSKLNLKFKIENEKVDDINRVKLDIIERFYKNNIYCCICKRYLSRKMLKYHIKSKKHLRRNKYYKKSIFKFYNLRNNKEISELEILNGILDLKSLFRDKPILIKLKKIFLKIQIGIESLERENKNKLKQKKYVIL